MQRIKVDKDIMPKIERPDILLKFLKCTSEGEYAEIERSSIPFARMQEETQCIPNLVEEEYYYSFS